MTARQWQANAIFASTERELRASQATAAYKQALAGEAKRMPRRDATGARGVLHDGNYKQAVPWLRSLYVWSVQYVRVSAATGRVQSRVNT